MLGKCIRTSPNSWKRAFSPRKTPAVVGPEFNPTRSDKALVPYIHKLTGTIISKIRRIHKIGTNPMNQLYKIRTVPNVSSRDCVTVTIALIHFFANLAITTA